MMQFFFQASSLFHPLCYITEEQHAIPMSDQERISHHSINTISSRQVMKIEKNTRGLLDDPIPNS